MFVTACIDIVIRTIRRRWLLCRHYMEWKRGKVEFCLIMLFVYLSRTMIFFVYSTDLLRVYSRIFRLGVAIMAYLPFCVNTRLRLSRSLNYCLRTHFVNIILPRWNSPSPPLTPSSPSSSRTRVNYIIRIG